MSIDSLGGYRLVRKLGEGPRAEVYLGYADATDSPPAAIKHYRPGVSQRSVMTEIEALSRARGDHVVELRDLSTAPDLTTALLLQRLPGISLSRLLEERTHIRLGEAITILAPLATTVTRLHVAGVVHRALAADAVMFDASGSPVLARFGAAQLIPPGMSAAALQTQPLIAADLTALADLVESVLARVHYDAAADMTKWFVSLVQQHPERAATELTKRLFEAGNAEPVSFAEPPRALTSLPNRVLAAEPLVDSPVTGGLARAALALPEWVERLLPSARSLARVRPALAAVRPRVWIVASGVAVALMVAVLLVPTGESDATSQAASPPAGPLAASPTARATAVEGPVSPIAGDDPVAALTALLSARQQCMRAMSVLCLDTVGEVGSSALATDREELSEVQSGGEAQPDWQITAVTLDERLGNSALVTVDDPAESEPASFLLVKGEAGWRIRDYLWR